MSSQLLVKIGYRPSGKIFSRQEFFFKFFDFHKNYESEIEEITKKHLVVLAMQFFTKSILRPMIFTETTRQRGSQETF